MATQGPAGGVHRSLDVAALLARKGDHTAIEVKATATVSNADLKGLRALAEEGRFKRYVLVCGESRSRQVGEVLVLPVAEFLRSLWDGEFAEAA
jgi:hypothetical protein